MELIPDPGPREEDRLARGRRSQHEPASRARAREACWCGHHKLCLGGGGGLLQELQPLALEVEERRRCTQPAVHVRVCGAGGREAEAQQETERASGWVGGRPGRAGGDAGEGAERAQRGRREGAERAQSAQVSSSARARMQPYTPPPSGLLSGAAAAHARACGPPPSSTPASTSPALAMRWWPGVAPSSEPPGGRWGLGWE